MRIPLIRGRALSERDDKAAPKVMLINETLARRFFPGEDPVGKRAPPSLAPDFNCEIVGIVSADYLRAMPIPLIRGRALSERDDKAAPKVMLINETLARPFFPGEDPVGKRATPSLAPDFNCEIVGIVSDVKHPGLDAEAGPGV